MKRIFYLFFFSLLFCVAQAQERVFEFKDSNTSVTQSKENSKSLIINDKSLKNILDGSESFFLPLINESFIKANLISFNVLDKNHTLILENENGQKVQDFESNLKSYYININNEIIGTFLSFDNSLIITYKHENRQFEINKINDEIILFDVNDCINKSNFSCAVENEYQEILYGNTSFSSSTTPDCIELAIEIDQYTRNTFSSNTLASNWGHAIIAGVSQIFMGEINVQINIVNTIIWNAVDPYASIVNDASAMLVALKNQWISNNSSINRDLVHLLTKRSNTGTGGIAYLDGLCDNSWGYAFSSDMNSNTSFSFPNPAYTWNLFVVAHEIGHNIGSRHTHWCGWSAVPSLSFIGGPIDNCVDVQGSCPNNVNPQVGTIMSYCHTTSFGSILDFHPVVVSQALNPGINSASCLTVCPFYGCTDSTALNYDPLSTVDDGSCIYPPISLTATVDDISCHGLSDGSINLHVSGGASTYTFLWSNGQTTEDIYNLSSGSYFVVVTDSINQQAIASFNIVEPDSLYTNYTVINASASTSNDGSIYAFTFGGVTPYTYYWLSTYINDTTQHLLNVPTGSYTSYILDDNGCFTFEIITVGFFSTIFGCTDSTALNFDSLATVDDGSCFYNIFGCTDPQAINYNPLATIDDGSCVLCISCQCNNPPPSGLYFFDVIDTRAKIGWNNMNDTSCMVWKYYVRFREVGTPNWTTKSAGVGNGLCNFGLNTTTKQLLNLNPSTTYEFKLKAFYCNGSSSNYSPTVQFTTKDICPEMTNLSVQTFSYNHAKARFSWDSTSSYIFARIKLRIDSSGAPWTTAGGFGVYYPVLYVNKFGLQSGKNYRAQGRTFCDSNITAYRSQNWTNPIFWTQPGSISLKNSSNDSLIFINIYPNPVENIFSVEFELNKETDISLELKDIFGNLILSFPNKIFVGSYRKQVNLSNFAAGTYILKIKIGSSFYYAKLLLV